MLCQKITASVADPDPGFLGHPNNDIIKKGPTLNWFTKYLVGVKSKQFLPNASSD